MLVNFSLVLTLLAGTVVQGSRVVLALYALQLGAESLTVGILAATFSVFPTLFSWPAGKLADRFGSRWLLLSGAVSSALGMLAPYWLPGMAMIFIAAAMNGLSFSIFTVAVQNLLGLLSIAKNRTKNFSNYSLAMSMSSLFGPLIAGFAIDHGGHAATCLYLGLLALVPAVMLTLWGGALPGGTRPAGHAGGGIGTLLSNPGVRRTLATSSLLQSGQDLFQVYMPVYGHAIGLSASAIGVVFASNAVAAFVVRFALPRLIGWSNEETVLTYAFCLAAVGFGLVPFFTGGVMLALIAFMFGLGMGCGQPIVTMLMFSHSAEGRSGEALGLRMTVNNFTRVLGPIIFGAIASPFGLTAVFWINALMLGSGSALSRGATVNRGADQTE